MADELPDLSDLVEPFDVLEMLRRSGALPEGMTRHLISATLQPGPVSPVSLIVEVDGSVEVLEEVYAGVPPIRTKAFVRDEPPASGYFDEWRVEFAGLIFTPVQLGADGDVVRLTLCAASEEPA